MPQAAWNDKRERQYKHIKASAKDRGESEDVAEEIVSELPKEAREETERRWQITTPQWPIMRAVLYGVTRDQMMAALGTTRSCR